VKLPESAEQWAQRLKEKKDYRALAAINNSQDYNDPFHWRKRDIANRILVENGAEALDYIIEELRTDGVGSIELAEVLVKIGDPKAVPILKKKLDRGDFNPYLTQAPSIREFVEKYPELTGDVEMVKCFLCGKIRPVTETLGYHDKEEVKRFCRDVCWRRRGRFYGSEAGVGCPYYKMDRMCGAGSGEPSPCSFTFAVGPSYSSCYVYRYARAQQGRK